jgi:hypothetical protein
LPYDETEVRRAAHVATKRRQAAAVQIGKLPVKEAGMQTADNGSTAEMTEAISARLHAQWEAWKNQDAASPALVRSCSHRC